MSDHLFIDDVFYLTGEVSKITGIPKDTLYFYDKVGLLKPEQIDPKNHYRYYSHRNLWQLDVITTCRKLNIPIEKIKEILSFKDNQKVTDLLNEYKNEALHLSRYYQKVAEDISWYESQNEKIKQTNDSNKIVIKELEERTVIIGNQERDESSYHANLQEACKDVVSNSPSIKRQYGYVLDIKGAKNNLFYRKREYIQLEESNLTYVDPSNIFTIPSGKYAVCTIEIHGKHVDFSSLFEWLDKNGYQTDAIYADEVGLQLFEYYDFFCEIKAHLI